MQEKKCGYLCILSICSFETDITRKLTTLEVDRTIMKRKTYGKTSVQYVDEYREKVWETGGRRSTRIAERRPGRTKPSDDLWIKSNTNNLSIYKKLLNIMRNCVWNLLPQ